MGSAARRNPAGATRITQWRRAAAQGWVPRSPGNQSFFGLEGITNLLMCWFIGADWYATCLTHVCLLYIYINYSWKYLLTNTERWRVEWLSHPDTLMWRPHSWWHLVLMIRRFLTKKGTLYIWHDPFQCWCHVRHCAVHMVCLPDLTENQQLRARCTSTISGMG